MIKYKVKDFENKNGVFLQKEMKAWVESRSHINIVDRIVWFDPRANTNLGSIIYVETDYNL